MDENTPPPPENNCWESFIMESGTEHLVNQSYKTRDVNGSYYVKITTCHT